MQNLQNIISSSRVAAFDNQFPRYSRIVSAYWSNEQSRYAPGNIIFSVGYLSLVHFTYLNAEFRFRKKYIYFALVKKDHLIDMRTFQKNLSRRAIFYVAA